MQELSSHHLSLKLLNTFQDDDYIYFITEHCPHGTLTQLASLYPDKKVPLNIVQVYTAQIIVFLNHIHSNGIVHRDLKPENILIGFDLSIKVIDFGDSKFIDPLKNEQFNQYKIEDSDEED